MIQEQFYLALNTQFSCWDIDMQKAGRRTALEKPVGWLS